MTNREQDLVVKIARCVLEKRLKNRNEVIDYHTISRTTNISIHKIKTLASHVCRFLTMFSEVEDSDIYDNDGIDVMLKCKRLYS